MKEAKPKAGDSLIYVYRDVAPVGWGVTHSISLDERYAGEISPDTFYAFQVAPGPHKITARVQGYTFKVDVDIQTELDKSYFLKLNSGWTSLVLSQVTEGEGREAIRGYDLLASLDHNLGNDNSGGSSASGHNYTPKPDPAAEAAFPEIARKYREAAVKPELPEEAHKYAVQADFAIEKKNLPAAIGRYDDTLKVAPWWPEGHLKRGHLLAEIERYHEAISEMKKVLLLAPDAKEAREAQDNIYKWTRGRSCRTCIG